MSSAYPVGDFEELEVQIVREAWNTYDLEDGTRIKARGVLTKVLWPKGVEPQKGEAIELGASINNIVVVFAPESLRGPPNPKPPTVRGAAKLKTEEIEVVDSKEEWSVYRIEKGSSGLKLRMVLTQVLRVVDVYDKEGAPYYIVNSSFVLGPTSLKEEIPP